MEWVSRHTTLFTSMPIFFSSSSFSSWLFFLLIFVVASTAVLFCSGAVHISLSLDCVKCQDKGSIRRNEHRKKGNTKKKKVVQTNIVLHLCGVTLSRYESLSSRSPLFITIFHWHFVLFFHTNPRNGHKRMPFVRMANINSVPLRFMQHFDKQTHSHTHTARRDTISHRSPGFNTASFAISCAPFAKLNFVQPTQNGNAQFKKRQTECEKRGLERERMWMKKS